MNLSNSEHLIKKRLIHTAKYLKKGWMNLQSHPETNNVYLLLTATQGLKLLNPYQFHQFKTLYCHAF